MGIDVIVYCIFVRRIEGTELVFAVLCISDFDLSKYLFVDMLGESHFLYLLARSYDGNHWSNNLFGALRRIKESTAEPAFSYC